MFTFKCHCFVMLLFWVENIHGNRSRLYISTVDRTSSLILVGHFELYAVWDKVGTMCIVLTCGRPLLYLVLLPSDLLRAHFMGIPINVSWKIFYTINLKIHLTIEIRIISCRNFRTTQTYFRIEHHNSSTLEIIRTTANSLPQNMPIHLHIQKRWYKAFRKSDSTEK